VISCVSKSSVWQIVSSYVAVTGLPPRDPNDDEENEEDDQNGDQEDEEPAVIREPDEC
jgi:hypothetical protein